MLSLITFSLSFAAIPVKRALESSQQSNYLSVENSVNETQMSIAITEYLAPGYGGGPGFGIASLACGIAACLFLGFPLFSVCAIVFGAIGLNRDLKGVAIAGISLGAFAIAILLALFLPWLWV